MLLYQVSLDIFLVLYNIDISFRGVKMNLYLIIKGILDFTLSLLAVLLLWPLFAIIAIFIKIDSKGPVFFKQKRIGKRKKHFYIQSYYIYRRLMLQECFIHFALFYKYFKINFLSKKMSSSSA